MRRHFLRSSLAHTDPRVTMNVYTQVLVNEIDDAGLVLRNAAGF